MRYFFHMGFHGQHYRGWQRQAKGSSVQLVVESVLSKVLKTSTSVMGCGRTDAQVHASQFFFHTDIEKVWDYDLLFRINKQLPDDIAIFEIIPVEANQHARFDATLRTYDYFIHTYKDPFLSSLSSLYLEKNLDVDRMKQATLLLPRYNDYGGLCKTPADNRTTVCQVTTATLYSDTRGDRLRFQISANRFLGKMVRIIVGKLLDIGRGEITVDEFEQALITRKTPKTIEPAYPQGLYLSNVQYPYLRISPRTEFSAIHQDLINSWKPI